VVLSPGIGDRRQVYRFLAPDLAQAGYRVASVDLRGHGDSSLGWPSITRTDVAGDLIAVIRHLLSTQMTHSLGLWMHYLNLVAGHEQTASQYAG
jgi:alpha-beta hydrolase superfamily lysophospholipase